VEVNVLPQPAVTSALMVLEPPLLSLTATDGAGGPAPQYLTVSNPGVQPLNWSLSTSVPQDSPLQNLNGQNDYAWLHTDTTAGVVAPGASERVQVTAQSQQLLPGVYGGILLFSVNGDPLAALQPVAIALTVQPRCGVVSSPGSIALSVVAGQQTQFDQPLAIGTTPGCSDATNWQAFPQASWLTMTPVSGQLKPGVIVKDALHFDTSSLAPGTYNTQVDLLTEMRSQTLPVRLTVLSSSTSTAPVTGTTPGVTPVSTPSPAPSSTVAPTPTPVPPSCVLQVSPANLTFAATFLQANPPPQTLTISVTGNCSQPVSWAASVDAASKGWLHLSQTSGHIGKSGITIQVKVNANNKMFGTYNGQITLTAIDKSGTSAQGSPRSVPVTLFVVL
jgi:Viral BACON domain